MIKSVIAKDSKENTLMFERKYIKAKVNIIKERSKEGTRLVKNK